MDKIADVVPIHGADWPSEQILRKALDQAFSGVVIIGWLKEPDTNGKKFYLASSYGAAEPIIYAIQHANLTALEWSR